MLLSSVSIPCCLPYDSDFLDRQEYGQEVIQALYRSILGPGLPLPPVRPPIDRGCSRVRTSLVSSCVPFHRHLTGKVTFVYVDASVFVARLRRLHDVVHSICIMIDWRWD